jgi:hypothetical protein
MALTLLPIVLALGSGVAVGLVLGLIGGGGSILAVPLLVYVVGVTSAHVAIGTGAIAVAVNAAAGLAAHARAGTVKWRCAGVFAVSGMAGAFAGSTLGKAMDGDQLMALFGVIMIVVGLAMARPGARREVPDVHLHRGSAARLLPRLVPIGLGVGLLSGFFGIGGGFLIVPGLMLATRMPMKNAVGTSLVAVTAFGLTTAGNYALSGLVDWPLAALVIVGGVLGGLAGTRAAVLLAARKRALVLVFSGIVIAVGLYVTWHGFTLLGASGA